MGQGALTYLLCARDGFFCVPAERLKPFITTFLGPSRPESVSIASASDAAALRISAAASGLRAPRTATKPSVAKASACFFPQFGWVSQMVGLAHVRVQSHPVSLHVAVHCSSSWLSWRIR